MSSRPLWAAECTPKARSNNKEWFGRQNPLPNGSKSLCVGSRTVPYRSNIDPWLLRLTSSIDVSSCNRYAFGMLELEARSQVDHLARKQASGQKRPNVDQNEK